MFAGEPERVVLEWDASLINVVIDRFGREVDILSKTEHSFRIQVEVALTQAFLGWLFMFGGEVRIQSPRNSSR